MNDNLKNLLEKISADEGLCAKFDPISKMEDKAAANETILALAAEVGMPLTAEDLQPEENLDLDELDAVAGGAFCPNNSFNHSPIKIEPACGCIKAGWGYL